MALPYARRKRKETIAGKVAKVFDVKRVRGRVHYQITPAMVVADIVVPVITNRLIVNAFSGWSATS